MSRKERTQEQEQKSKKIVRTVLLLVIALLLLLGLVCCHKHGGLAWLTGSSSSSSQSQSGGQILAPDKPPVSEDDGLEDIGGTDDKLDAPEGGGAVNITYSPQVLIDLSDNMAALMFQNPGKSTEDMLVQLIIQDQLIAQSGKLVPGKQLNTVKLVEGAAAKLQEGSYDGKFLVSFYDPETGQKAMVNSEGMVTVTVVK